MNRRLRKKFCECFCALILCPVPAIVQAATSTWTSGGADDNWSTPQNWNSPPANDGSGSIVMTGFERPTPNIDVPWNINALTFDNDANPFTIGGSTLTIGSGGITQGSQGDQTLNMPIVLSADQTWSVTNLSRKGLLTFGPVNTNGHQLTITGNAVFQSGGLINGVISGSGSLVINTADAASLAVYGQNTFSGGVFLKKGILFIEGDQNLGAAGNAITFDGGTMGVGRQGTINRDITLAAGGARIYSPIAQGQNLTLGGSIHGPGSLSLKGGGDSNITLTGVNTYTGGTFLDNVKLVGTTNTIQGNVSLRTSPAQLEFQQSFNGTYSGNISGDGTVLLTGTGLIALSGNNTFSGSTLLYDGGLELYPGMNLPASSAVIFSGNSAVIQVVGGGRFTSSTVGWNGSGGFAARDGKLNVNLGGNSTQFTLQLGKALVFGSPSSNSVTEFENPIFLASANSSPPPTVRVNSGTGGDYAILSGQISGANMLAKTGNGLLQLTAANTYGGGTAIAGGALSVSSDANLGAASGPLMFESGGRLLMSAPFDMARAITFDSGGGSIDVPSGAVNISGNFSIRSGSSFTKTGPGSLALTGTPLHQLGSQINVSGGALKLSFNSGRPATASAAATAYVSLNLTGNNTSVTLDTSQDLRGLSVPFANPGDQSLDLHSPATPGAFNAVRIYGAGLAAAKSALWQALKLASNPETPTPFDGIFDSGASAHPGSRVGIALIRDAHNDQHLAIRLTRIGDLNLDGAVTIGDFIDLASHFGSTTATWQEGDMNYDSAVTITDFIDLASNFNTTYAGDVFPISAADQQTLASFAAAHGAANVPEPTGFVSLMLGASLLRRRRIKNPRIAMRGLWMMRLKSIL